MSECAVVSVPCVRECAVCVTVCLCNETSSVAINALHFLSLLVALSLALFAPVADNTKARRKHKVTQGFRQKLPSYSVEAHFGITLKKNVCNEEPRWKKNESVSLERNQELEGPRSLLHFGPKCAGRIFALFFMLCIDDVNFCDDDHAYEVFPSFVTRGFTIGRRNLK